MGYHLLADLVLVIHFAFVLFVVGGGLLVTRWPVLAWAHVPAFVYGGMIGIFGWICPLTYIENAFRTLGGGAPRVGGFVTDLLMPLLYPELLFPEGFPEDGFLYLSMIVIGLNLLIYMFVYRRYRHEQPNQT